MSKAEDWKPNPELGGKHIESRKVEVIEHLKSASNVAFYHIDQQLERDIAELKKKAGEKRNKIVSHIKKAEQMPALTVVRKYWMKDADDLMHHLTDTIMSQGENQ